MSDWREGLKDESLQKKLLKKLLQSKFKHDKI